MLDSSHYQGNEQTYIKHYFLEHYLDRVAWHIGYWRGGLIYLDCFSGPWRSKDPALGDTSIRISLDKLETVRRQITEEGRRCVIEAAFVEQDPRSFATLEEFLATNSRGVPAKAFFGPFEDNIPNLLKHAAGRFAFFFIDPTGWTGFAMNRLSPILMRPRTEIMVNFMFDHINRFLDYDEETNERSLDELFGTTAWRKLRSIPGREEPLVRLYADQLRAQGRFPFATYSRVLKPYDDRTYFHLVYATHSPKGLEEFRKVEAKAAAEQDRVRAVLHQRNREQRTGQPSLPFGAPPGGLAPGSLEEIQEKEQSARACILGQLRDGPVAYEKLLPSLMEIPWVTRTRVNQLLNAGAKDGSWGIRYTSARDRAPKEGTIVEPAPNRKE